MSILNNKNSIIYRIAKNAMKTKKRLELYYRYLKDIAVLKFRYNNTNAIEEYPLTIQLPITFKCNFDCVMCGMRNLISQKDFTAEELSQILSDKLFQNVTGVGLNGGEPFLKKDLVECVEVIINNIPKLKDLNIISNGYFTDVIKDKLTTIYSLCQAKGIRLNISFSVDGIGEMQNVMRGNKNAWQNILCTLEEIKNHKETYCDWFQLICTVTKYNVYNLPEVEIWAKNSGYNISYNIATAHERICNQDKVSDFTILNDTKAKMVASEFFYKKAMELKSQRYYGLYLFIRDGIRYAYCPCQNNSWVTLTPDGSICYCATHSKELGNARNESAYEIFNRNTDYLDYIKSHYCKNCSHYMTRLDRTGLRKFYKELINNGKIIY